MQQPLDQRGARADLQRADLRRENEGGAEIVSHPLFSHPLWVLRGEWQDEEKCPLEEVFLRQFSLFVRQNASPSRNPIVVEREENGACSITLGRSPFGAFFYGKTSQAAADRLEHFWNFRPEK